MTAALVVPLTLGDRQPIEGDHGVRWKSSRRCRVSAAANVAHSVMVAHSIVPVLAGSFHVCDARNDETAGWSSSQSRMARPSAVPC
jgi:hypothetical protein